MNCSGDAHGFPEPLGLGETSTCACGSLQTTLTPDHVGVVRLHDGPTIVKQFPHLDTIETLTIGDQTP